MEPLTSFITNQITIGPYYYYYKSNQYKIFTVEHYQVHMVHSGGKIFFNGFHFLSFNISLLFLNFLSITDAMIISFVKSSEKRSL